MHTEFVCSKCINFQFKVMPNKMDGSLLNTVPLKRFVRTKFCLQKMLGVLHMQVEHANCKQLVVL